MKLFHKKQNSCYTYFRITGTFDPDDISAILCLTPDQTWREGDPIKDGRASYQFSCWQYGRCDTYNVFTDEMMMQTIANLIPKIPLLQTIRDEFTDINFSLEIVPTVTSGESTPSLSPNRAVIEFCYLTHTDIDIDLYL